MRQHAKHWKVSDGESAGRRLLSANGGKQQRFCSHTTPSVSPMRTPVPSMKTVRSKRSASIAFGSELSVETTYAARPIPTREGSVALTSLDTLDFPNRICLHCAVANSQPAYPRDDAATCLRSRHTDIVLDLRYHLVNQGTENSPKRLLSMRAARGYEERAHTR
jgi:hypothetical protein